jgi:electron transport complex protein RnfB
MEKDIFRRLQQRLDQYSVGFPATESGIELKILKALFSADDAALFLALSPRLETPETVARRLDRPLEIVAVHLEEMSRRGLLFRLEKGGTPRYGAIPFVHGLFEFQVKNLTQELAEMVEQYSREGFDEAMVKSEGYFLRTIPVGRSVAVTQHIASYDDAVEILRSKDKIVVTDCICRKRKELVDHSCGKDAGGLFHVRFHGTILSGPGHGPAGRRGGGHRHCKPLPGSGPGHPAGHFPEPIRNVQLLRRLLRRAGCLEQISKTR